MTTRGAWIRDATETDALEGGTAHHAIALEPRVDRETPRVGGGRHGAFVCVRARESVDEALGRAERDNDSRKHLREFRLNFVPFANQKRRRCRIVDIFCPLARETKFFFSGVFSRSVSLQSVALSRRPPAVLARRASSSPARRVSAPRSRPETGDRARSRRFERAPPGSPRDRRFFPYSRRPRFFLARRFGEGGKTSEVQRSAWQPSVVFVSRLTLVLSRVSMLTASSRLERRAARRPSDDARATLRLLLLQTRSSSVMMMIRAARSRLQRFPSTPRPPTLVS